MSKKIKYDNLFTSNLFTGDRNGLNLTSNNLTSKHWTELSIDRTYDNISFPKGAFFIIKTFTPEESSIIVNSIKTAQNQTVYFDQYGNLLIFEAPITSSPKPNLKINFINRTAYDGINVDLNDPKGVMTFKKNENPNLIMSEYNTYILNLFDKQKVQILYNPLHRKPFKKYYNSLSIFLNKNGYNSTNSQHPDSLETLVDKYCEMMAVSKSVNGDRKYSDKTCKCLGTNTTRTYGKTELGSPDPVGECIDDAIGHIANDSIRKSVGLNCVCAANSCESNDGNFDGTSSFVSDFKEKVRSSLPECPDITNTFCSMVVQAGGGINATSAKLTQECGNDAAYKKAMDENVPKQTPAATTPPPAATPAATTPPPAATTPPPAATTPPPAATTPPPAATTPPPAATTPPPAATTPPPSATPKPTPAATTPPPAATTPPPASILPSTPASTPAQTENSILPIIFGSVGGVILLAAIVFGVILYRRNRSTNSTSTSQ